LAVWCRNIAIVFVLSGLWHGANWTFVLWGALHGAYLIAGRLTFSARERIAGALGLARHPAIRRAIGVIVTFQLVSLAWLFFRATSIGHARALLARIWRAPSFDGPNPADAGALFSFSHDGHVLIAALLICALLVVEFVASRPSASERWSRVPVWLRWPAYDALILLMLWMGDLGARSFIYFQF